MKRVFFVGVACALLMHAMVSAQQITTTAAAPGDALSFFKNFFVTGDYVVAGVSLRGTGVNGFATGAIDLTGADIPDRADIMGAFLYWETVATPNSNAGASGAAFRSTLPGELRLPPIAADFADLTNIAKNLNPQGSAPCWSAGGGTGAADGAHQMTAYRADVLRFLRVGSNGKLLVKTKHYVKIPDAGIGNKVPATAGASLVVIYRDPSKPLRSIVLYDGGYTMDHSTQQMTQTVKGFFQASAPAVSAKITHIVGNGQPNFTERLLFNGGSLDNAFQGTTAASTTGTPAWDNVTIGPVNSLITSSEPLTGQNVTTAVTAVPGSSTFDCLSWGAIIFSTTVQDTDNDGLLDIWETSTTPLYNPDNLVLNSTGQFEPKPGALPLPNLSLMSADMNRKDIFFQIDYMQTGGYTSPNANATPQAPTLTVPGHGHLPSPNVLKMVGDAYKNAPVDPTSGAIDPFTGSNYKGIRAHFDVGSNYADDPLVALYLVPSALARGGSSIQEISESRIPETSCILHPPPDLADPTCGCTTDPSTNPLITTCTGQFKSYPGTVGWKTGFRFLRDQPLNDPIEPGRLRFDPSRLPMFRYVLFAHNLGLPKCFGLDSCTDFLPNGQPNLDPDFHTPTKTSGIADPPGGDILVTLGRWDDFKGTEYMQASSFFHEAGHNTGLRHGGIPKEVAGSLVFQPNCKPNYESVMNYLFQVQGLICDARSTSPQCANKAAGTPVIDYSRQQLAALNEASLTESIGLGTMAYRTRWYAPKTSSFIDNDTTGLATTPPTRYCDGTPITDLNQVAMVRVDGTSVTGGIDWNANGRTSDLIPPPADGQDINFSGTFTSFDAGSALGLNGKPQGDDWANVDLRHTASRRNVGGLSLGVFATDLSDADPGKGDTGKGDTGKGDTGKGDTGKGDTGKGDTGKGDTGKGDTGSAAAPVGDLELDTASALGNAPNTLTATNALKSITLNWKRPNVGTPTSYEVYRVIGTTVTPANFALKVLVGTVNPVLPATLPATTIVDTNVKNNTTYTYFAIAEFAGGIRSGTSNYVTQPH